MGIIMSKKSKVVNAENHEFPVSSNNLENIVNDNNVDNMKSIIEKIEQDAFTKVKEFHQNKEITTHEQFGNTLVDIMKSGAEEFENKTGRKMTYGEMCEAFGYIIYVFIYIMDSDTKYVDEIKQQIKDNINLLKDNINLLEKINNSIVEYNNKLQLIRVKKYMFNINKIYEINEVILGEYI